MNEDDEKFWAEMREKNKDWGGPAQTKEELAEEQRISDEEDPLSQLYPERDGTEFALLQDNGDIWVVYGTNSADGSHSTGERTYSPDHQFYREVWERHKMDEWQGKMHYIAKKWDAENNEWIDLGDHWFD